MKTLPVLLVALFCLTLQAQTFYQFNRYTTNLDTTSINGATLTNVPAAQLTGTITNAFQFPTNTVAANAALTMSKWYDITAATVTLGVGTFASVPSSTYSIVDLDIQSTGTTTFTNDNSITASDGLKSRVLSNWTHVAILIIPRRTTNLFLTWTK